MTSKKFLLNTLFVFFVFTSIIISLNYYLDDFGLFRSHKIRRVWRVEKTSKYLMSYKYIPENFNAVIVGSSVSVNMDPLPILKYKVYNLSMNSGNISELKYPLNNLIRSDSLDAIIFCLYDYTTKNSGIKGKQISSREYFGSLFSTLPFLILKSKLKFKLKPHLDVYKYSFNGFQDFNIEKRHLIFSEISEKYLENPRKDIIIDDTAYEEMRILIAEAHKKNIKIYGYFYPMYYKWFQIFKDNGNWETYKSKILRLFDLENDIIWDMNDEEYDYLRKNTKTYTDGHLSYEGAVEVIKIINQKINLK